MTYDKHTKIYFEMIMGVFQEIMMPMLEEKTEEHQNVMMNSILGLEGPKSCDRNTSPYEKFVADKLFRPFNEIMQTIESIRNIGVYARSFPYKRQGISRATYLKYHVENYLNELYLLKNRLITYLKAIDRSYKKSDIAEHVSKTIAPLYTFVSDTLKNYIEVRGAHVHQHRYSDDDFDRLSTLELLTLGGRVDKFGTTMTHLSDRAYSEIRKKWVAKISADIKGINKLLDYYFEVLLQAISEDKNLKIPNNIMKA
jgi:hypothetical protein